MKHLSLCSGIGGLDLAAEWAGFETAAQCEIDEYASRVLAKNFPGVPNLHDIRTVTNDRLAEYGIDRDEITVISAGFPCQPYSLAGKGLGDRDERDLWGEVARVVGEVRPRWFVGENTPGLFARSNQRYFRRVLDDLAALGYSVGWGIWGACDVGAPHKRDRVFMLGWNTDRKHEEKERSISDKSNPKSCGDCREIPDPALERCRKGKIQRGEPSQGWYEADKRRVRPCGVQPFGICSSPSWLRDRWETEPDVRRVADGIPHRVDRLRCLGNAVVPQQAYPIFEAIAKYEGGRYEKK